VILVAAGKKYVQGMGVKKCISISVS